MDPVAFTPNGVLMDERVKADWVAALRSGEYAQGFGALNKNGKYCCLGVLCELAVKEGILPPPVEGPVSTFGYGRVPNRTTLPGEVLVWTGLGLAVNNPTPHGTSRSLAEMNDRGASFSDIADVIEKGL